MYVSEGTFRLSVEVASPTRVPPCGAAPESVTLQGMESPPAIAADPQEITRDCEDGCGGVTVMMTVFIVDPMRAIIIALPLRDVAVVYVKTAVLPPVTVTDDGTTSPVLFEVNVTVVGSPGLVRVNVHVPPLPPTTLIGLHVNEESLGLGSRESDAV